MRLPYFLHEAGQWVDKKVGVDIADDTQRISGLEVLRTADLDQVLGAIALINEAEALTAFVASQV